MTICFFAPANSAHIIKWCDFFSSKEYEVHVVSFVNSCISNVTTHYIETKTNVNSSDSSKLEYLSKSREVRELINNIQPDVISVHYASSYGSVAALAGLKGYFLSVWGSDIYEFPRKSIFHKTILKYSLKKAPHLLSTSYAMAAEASKYTKKQFSITPFGVDMELFSPEKRRRKDDFFVIGTVKALSNIYGIDYLLKAVSIVRKNHPDIPIRLHIAGKGPDEKQLHELSRDLGLSSIVNWLGFISQEQAAFEWANFDLAVICSLRESFGVSAVEAQASGCPVIISDVPGLLETTKPGITSFVVPRMDEKAIADAITSLYFDKEKRKSMGIEGRSFVEQRFEFRHCFETIERMLFT